MVSKDDKIDYIHEDVLRKFSESFIKGFVDLMLELGFDPNIESLFSFFFYSIRLFIIIFNLV